MRPASAGKRLVAVLLCLLVAYLSLYTWNRQTGYLDDLASETGLEFVGWVLKPGAWAVDTATTTWSRYVYLKDVERENERLREALKRLAMQASALREDAAALKRLERALGFEPQPGWKRHGVRILSQRLGPAGALETVIMNRGEKHGLRADDPLVTPDGVLGRVYKTAANTSVGLLATDPNSRIPVLGQTSRTPGILTGQGAGKPQALLYVPLADPLEAGEILVTSGLGNAFPRGLPVARVASIGPSEDALFKVVHAEPLVDGRRVHEAFVLSRVARPADPADGLTPQAEAGP